MTPKIEMHFNVIGNFNPDNFTKATGLIPTSTWRTGEGVQGTLITRKFDGWKLSLGEIYSHDIDIQFKKLISILMPYQLSILSFCKKNNLNIEFSCVVTTEGDEFPSVYFDKKLINDINNFEADIDIDIY